MHLFYIPDWFNHAYVAAVAAIALWRGGPRPRAVALTLLIVTSMQHIIMRTWPPPTRDAPSHILEASLDLIILVVCLACAIRGRGYWVLWASSFVLLGLINQLLGFIGVGLSAWAIASGNIIWAYTLGAAIVWGVFAEPRRDRLSPGTP